MADTEDSSEFSENDWPIIREFEEHAKAIGFICLYWAYLGEVLNATLELLIPMHDRGFSLCLTSNIDFREKIQIAIALGHKRKCSNAWFENLLEQLNYIDNELRPERNRMVHDNWDWAGPEIVRRQYATKLKRLQARQPHTLTIEHVKAVPINTIWELAYKIYDASAELSVLNVEYALDDTSRPK